MCEALLRHGAEHTIVRWVKATLEGRQATATLGSLTRSVAVSKGCPQGGVLSPLLWCLVVDDLLARLSGSVHAQGYVDDICLLAVGKFNTVSGLIQMALVPLKSGAARSDCRLILTRLGSWPSREEGSSRASLNPDSSGGPYNAPGRSSIWE
jgi:hypothetical protein